MNFGACDLEDPHTVLVRGYHLVTVNVDINSYRTKETVGVGYGDGILRPKCSGFGAFHLLLSHAKG